MSVRITGLQEVATLQNGDYIAVDNASNGTHKFDAMKMGANMASNIAPAYSTAATYAIGDFCMHDGILYKCTTAINTPESWTASHWTQTSAGVALAQKVDKVSGKGLSQNDFTNALKTKLDGIASGAEVNVQANWTQTNTSADDYIKNKPTNATSSTAGFMSAADKAKLDGIASGAEVNVQANWTETNTSSDAYIKNKPTNATTSTAGLMSASDKTKLNGIASGAEVNVQADWSQTNTSADDYIKNKPVDATSSVGGLMSATDKAKLDSIEQGAEVNVQANWSQTNTSADDYIKNKPTNATTSTAGLMSASDKTKLNGIETGAQVNVIDGVKVDGTLLTVDGNKDVDIVGKANQASLASQYSSDTGNYVRGNYVIYQNNLYKCLQDTSGVWDATKWEQVDIGDDLEQKANIDGLYEEMTVGGAEQLISGTFNIESVPYNFRTSGGSLDIGDRETDKLIGGTVAWNQLAHNFVQRTNILGVTITPNTDGSITITGTATSTNTLYFESNVPLTKNHIYLLCGAKSHGINISNYDTVIDTGNGALLKPTQDISNGQYVYRFNSGDVINETIYPQRIDLTAMFGSTIADYIYTLETQTTGAGVAFFKKLFPAPYYAYNAGQLMSVNAGSHVMNGFNQWDEEWEHALYNASGEKVANNNYIASTNKTRVLGDTDYCITSKTTGTGVSFFICEYDGSQTFIKRNSYGSGDMVGGKVHHTEANTRFVTFCLGAQSTPITTYNNDICINIAWDGERNGEYEPYVSHTYELDDTLELRGIPKLDVNNQLYYDGDVYESDGSVTRKYGIVDLGTLTWVSTTTNIADTYRMRGTLAVSAKVPSASNIRANIVCAKYANIAATETNEGVTGISIDTGGYVRVYDPSYNTQSSASAFAASVSGVYLVYELETPTTESATPYTNPQIVSDWGTETYTDYSYDAQTRDVQIPVGHETRYMANLKAKLEMAPESPNGDGDYIVRQTSGENAYVAIGSSPTIQHKAEIDGTYDDMNVGGAKQLLSNVFEEDQVPYTFRTSGGSIDIGDREYDEIVGGTVAWNQTVMKNGNTIRKQNITAVYNDTTEVLKISGTGYNGVQAAWFATNTTLQNVSYTNHIYYIRGEVTSHIQSEPDSTTPTFGAFNQSNATFKTCGLISNGQTVKAEFIVYGGDGSSSSNKRMFGIRLPNGVTSDDYVEAKNLMLVDLTQMFGTTIADYIYSLEQATAGAGVAWFRKLFPKDYYEYNAGELLSVEGVSSHDMTGFNQLDDTEVMTNAGFVQQQDGSWYIQYASVPYLKKVWENKLGYSGRICVSYEYKYSTTNVGVILVIKYTDGSATSCSYQGTTSYMKSVTVSASNKVVDNIYFTYSNNGSGSYFKNLCINFSWDGERDGEYEPYVKRSYALDSDLELRGIPKLDASNNLYYDGDTYESDGTVTRTWQTIVFDGTEDWRASSNANRFYLDYRDAGFRYKFASDVGAMCYGDYLYYGASSGSTYLPDKQFALWYPVGQTENPLREIMVHDTSCTTADEFKAKLQSNPMRIIYETDPTTETADPYTNPQVVDDWGTEEYVTTSIVPVGHNTKYTANLRAKIEMAPDSPSGDGDYIVRQADGTNSYVPLVIPNELPTMPTTDGTYRLQVVVASGTPTLSWVSAT